MKYQYRFSFRVSYRRDGTTVPANRDSITVQTCLPGDDIALVNAKREAKRLFPTASRIYYWQLQHSCELGNHA